MSRALCQEPVLAVGLAVQSGGLGGQAGELRDVGGLGEELLDAAGLVCHGLEGSFLRPVAAAQDLGELGYNCRQLEAGGGFLEGGGQIGALEFLVDLDDLVEPDIS